MKVVTASEMQKIDRISIDEIGIPGSVLMGYAGKSIADYIDENIDDLKNIAVFCGTGNNGGDGFVIAYFLMNMGYHVDVFIAGKVDKISETALTYFNICRNSGIALNEVDKQYLLDTDLDSYSLIIDAMLGTGFKGTPRGIIKYVIETINDCSSRTLSVDLPSGLPSDGEVPEGDAIYADYTITIGLPKISCVTYPGIKYIGKLLISDIGFPKTLTESNELKIDLLDNSYAERYLNRKNNTDAHKGENGHLLLVGGFDGMEGAIILAAYAAFVTGVGLASLITTNEARQIIAGKIPELITRSFGPLDLNNSAYSDSSIKNIENNLKSFFNEGRNYDAMVIGPGMGRTEAASIFFNKIISNLPGFGIKKALIDGDGLFHLAEFLKNNSLPDNVSFIITPHFFEASRLVDYSVDEIKKNRLQCALDLAKKTNAVTLLKGPATIITYSGKTLINSTGNRALATAGSGDVLSGIIGALLLRGISPMDSAGIGAYIHGLAADIYIKENTLDSMKSTDILDYIRPAMNSFSRL